MNENISDSINDLVPFLVSTRRKFHAMPELSFQENATAAAIASELQSLGLEVQTGIGKTGLTAEIQGASDGPTLMIRADIDGLPIDEATGLEFASTNGVMHACGHDGHIAVALGTARVLAGDARPTPRPCRVRLPARRGDRQRRRSPCWTTASSTTARPTASLARTSGTRPRPAASS